MFSIILLLLKTFLSKRYCMKNSLESTAVLSNALDVPDKIISQKDSISLKKFHKNLPYDYCNTELNDAKKETKATNLKSSNKSSSTLSLHIAAYENFVETQNTDMFANNELPKNIPDASSARKILPSLSQTCQDPFEFPRQMEDNESSTTPQIQQFTTSQRLLSPNQEPPAKKLRESHVKVEIKSHFTLKDDQYHHCNYCDKKYKFDPTGSTTNRRDHILNAHTDKLKNEPPEAKHIQRLNFFPQISGNERVNRAIVRFFAQFNLPFSAVESETFLELMNCSGKNVKLPCRKTLSSVLIPHYATEIRALNGAATDQEDISLSFDEYSKGIRRFLGIVCSYVDCSWNLRFRRLSVESFPKTTSGAEIALAVQRNMDKLTIKSVVGSTRDGGSNVVKACSILEYNDIHCYDHVLNLGIFFAYKSSSAYVLVEMAKSLSSSFSKSPTASVYLRECGAEYSMKASCVTRWNWMGRVVRCILQNYDALIKFAYHHTEGKKSPQRRHILAFSDEDINSLKEFNLIFDFFEQQFKMAEGRTALASSILYMAYQVVGLARKGSKNELVNDFLKKFLVNFEPRVKSYEQNETIRIATFLDLRFSMKPQLFSRAEWEDIQNIIIEKFDVAVPSGVEVNDRRNNEEMPFGWTDFNEEPMHQNTSTLKEEIKGFLNEKRLPAPLPNKNTTHLVFNFWKENEKKYPLLASISRKYLSILASSSEPERCFSGVTDLLANPHRNAMSDGAIEDIMTIKNELVVEKAEKCRKKDVTIFDEIFMEADEEEEEFELIIAEESELSLLGE